MKLGAFGSTVERKVEWIVKKEGPSPGQYDINSDLADATTDFAILGKAPKTRVQTSADAERRKSNSVFNSTTNRFDLTYNSKNPNIRLLTSNGG